METHVTFVLDSSGSMSAIRDDTIGGFNTFLQDQQTADGAATVSLFEFDSTVSQVYRGVAVEGAPELTHETYTPGGQTALHDAITTAVGDTMEFVEAIDGADRPESVVVVVLTDGKENASETPQEVVRERVESQQAEHGWEFLFIGANQDAALAAEGMGIDKQNSLDMAHTGEAAQAAYESTSDRVREVRETGQSDGFTEEDRQRQNDAE